MSARLRSLFLIAAGAFTCSISFGQSLAIGAIGGMRATNDLTGEAATSVSGRYVLGPELDIGLPFGLGFEVDALYRRQGYQASSFYSGQFDEHANSWEFPILLKYKLPFPLIRPLLEAGYAPRVINGTVHFYTNGSTDGTDYPTSQGIVVGGGVQFGMAACASHRRSATLTGTTRQSSWPWVTARSLNPHKTRRTSCSASPGSCISAPAPFFRNLLRYSLITLPKPRIATGQRGALGVRQAHSTIGLFLRSWPCVAMPTEGSTALSQGMTCRCPPRPEICGTRGTKPMPCCCRLEGARLNRTVLIDGASVPSSVAA